MRAGCAFRLLEGFTTPSDGFVIGLCGLAASGANPIPTALSDMATSEMCSGTVPPPACVGAVVELFTSLGCNGGCVADIFTGTALCDAAGPACEATALPLCDGSDVEEFVQMMFAADGAAAPAMGAAAAGNGTAPATGSGVAADGSAAAAGEGTAVAAADSAAAGGAAAGPAAADVVATSAEAGAPPVC